MDKDRVKRLCETVLGISYSGTTICGFDMTPTFKYDESLSKWVPDSFALFVQIKAPLTREFYQPKKVQETLEGVLGFDCCVDFI
jgi:hypothetical protein